LGVTLPPFQALLDQHQAAVYRLLVRLVGPVDADDCFQETFIAALRTYPTLKDPSNLRGWLLTIANRKAMDHHRGRARAPVATGDMRELDGAVAPVGLADGDVWASVRRLPPKQSMAVAPRFANDLAYKDIGRILGCTEAAARRNVHEGLKRLRQEYVK
jgi:DNA-directed RNA polymerase specialized sigma24 family protein